MLYEADANQIYEMDADQVIANYFVQHNKQP